MAGSRYKHVGKSPKYKYVSIIVYKDGGIRYKMAIPNKICKYYDTEREAALAVDKYFISKKKNPVNILKAA